MKTIYNYILVIIIFWPFVLNAQTRVVKDTIKNPTDGTPKSKVFNHKISDNPKETTTVEEMLQGRTGGVDISSVSGDPGEDLNIRISDTLSLNANNFPLIIVNGIPYAADFDNFDFANADIQKFSNLIDVAPEEIESIEVLKDAATTSMYGAAAANGVLKIKTKDGKAGKVKINFNSHLLKDTSATATNVVIKINTKNKKTFKIENLKRPDKLIYQSSKNDIFKSLIISDDFPYNIVASSNLPDSLVNFGYNSFFYGMYQAYADHRPFVLSPDMIWLLISQGFSRHVNLNAEELRKYFVDFSGKTELYVRNDKIDLSNPNSPWELVFPKFTKQIGKYTGKDLIDVLSSNFSTTTTVEKVASEITIMEAMKPYFNYTTIRIVCGIPEITLEGTTEDWQNVLNKAQYLKKYKLDWWIDEIEPILKEFVKASKGEVDAVFWRNMFKIHSKGTCGSPEIIDGWIVKFFPYDKNGNRNGLKEIKGKDNLPQEIVKVDMKFVESINGQDFNTPLELWAGFFGLEQDKSTFSLKPKIGWLIRKKNVSKDAFKQKFDSENNFEDGIRIRVREIPEQLLQIPEIYILDIQFENEIKIPEELKNVRMGKLKLSGRISDSAAVRISKLFPKTQLIINEKVYKNSESSDWIVVYDSIPQNVLKKEYIWILQVWNQGKFSMPDNIKKVKIDKLQFINKLDEEEIKRINTLEMKKITPANKQTTIQTCWL
jgi:TonB-dependent SusC/RagA subfamily outer membrane receptor